MRVIIQFAYKPKALKACEMCFVLQMYVDID